MSRNQDIANNFVADHVLKSNPLELVGRFSYELGSDFKKGTLNPLTSFLLRTFSGEDFPLPNIPKDLKSEEYGRFVNDHLKEYTAWRHKPIVPRSYNGYFIDGDEKSGTVTSSFGDHFIPYGDGKTLAQAIKELEEYDSNRRKELVRALLLLSQGVNPAGKRAAYMSTVPTKNGKPQFTADYLAEMEAAVVDDIKASLSFMSTPELKRWAGEFASAMALLQERENKVLELKNKAHALNIPVDGFEHANGRNLDIFEAYINSIYNLSLDLKDKKIQLPILDSLNLAKDAEEIQESIARIFENLGGHDSDQVTAMLNWAKPDANKTRRNFDWTQWLTIS